MGALTYDDVFNMDYDFACTLQLINYEEAMFNKRYEIASKLYNEK